MSLSTQTLKSQLQALSSKRVSSVELVQEQITRAQAINADNNAFISFNADGALEQAKQADQARADGSTQPSRNGPNHDAPESRRLTTAHASRKVACRQPHCSCR